MGIGVTAFTIRDELVDALRMAMDVPVHAEQPDAITPETVTVEWAGTAPGDLPSFVNHEFEIVCWPYTDLTADGPKAHFPSRDRLVTAVVEQVRVWEPPKGSTMGSVWEASPDTRDLGGQSIRVAVVMTMVIEAVLC